MFRFPRILPAYIRSLLDSQLKGESLEEILCAMSGVLLRLFNAQDNLLLFQVPFSGELSAQSIVNLNSVRQDLNSATLEEIPQRWIKSGLHESVSKDLKSRSSCISYSAFSWPYPHLGFAEESDVKEFSIPRDYTLFIPISSDLIVSKKEDPEFFGYYALMFERFPELSESVVQLIVLMPSLLSDLTATGIRTLIPRLSNH